jgi:hypothetical protein
MSQYFYMLTMSFHENPMFFVSFHENGFVRDFFLSFYASYKNIIFSQNLVCAYRILRRKRKFSVQIFWHFEMLISDGKSICSHVPNWISVKIWLYSRFKHHLTVDPYDLKNIRYQISLKIHDQNQIYLEKRKWDYRWLLSFYPFPFSVYKAGISSLCFSENKLTTNEIWTSDGLVNSSSLLGNFPYWIGAWIIQNFS